MRAITNELVTPYNAVGVDFSNLRGLANEFAMPMLMMMADIRRPSLRAAVIEDWLTRPSKSISPRGPKGIRIAGRLSAT